MVLHVNKYGMNRWIVCHESMVVDIEGLVGGCYAHRGLVIHDNCDVMHIE